ncbi:LRR domain containing protein [Parasponia andersonii]|uniref:LRR domain containing protein n=1 Tax=Parasponia andersonii TaxID=3476 RepID=A0A2P5ACF3_PARAD|nr:LRR domain containing protein [Parasponia andersonii]
METQLAKLCIEAACESRESVEQWRKQKRSLERLPSQLADALLRRLLSRRLLYPSLLEVFKESVEEVDLRGQSSVDAEWMAYIGAFRCLRSLNVADCHRLTSFALWPITGMTSLKELDISRCSKVNDAAIRHVVSISTLEKLFVSETGLTTNGVELLSSLRNLSVLDLGGLPVDDLTLSSLRVLTKLQYLDLWGSEISDQGACVLQGLPGLTFLNLAWTNVRTLPNLSSLKCLNMSNCTIESLLEGDGDQARLDKLVISGATFVDDSEAFMRIQTCFLSYIDLANSSLCRFSFIHRLKVLQHLDLSSTLVGDDEVEEIASVGANLRYLNLSNTKVSSAGIGILTGHVPNLEILSLSNTLVDDVAISYISLMPSLKDIDLSNTNTKGIIYQVGSPETEPVPSLLALQSLRNLKKLNLEQTQVSDAALYSVSSLQELTHLSLGNFSLTDISLSYMSSLTKLTNLSIHDAVLTNGGLNSFQSPAALRMMDLTGCWLLTEDAIVSFCKTHSHVEVIHEDVHVFPSDLRCLDRPSPYRSTVKTSQLSQEDSKIPISPCFIDQRLKYSREELLGLQYSSLSLAPSPRDGDTSMTPNSPLN